MISLESSRINLRIYLKAPNLEQEMENMKKKTNYNVNSATLESMIEQIVKKHQSKDDKGEDKENR